MTAPANKKVTIATLAALKARGEKAVFLTAYDYPTAVFADRAGVDMLLVGDSAAMTMLGHPSTVSITMDEMLVFARAVCRGAKRALVVGDLPFLSYQVSDEDAVRNAGAFIAAGCDAVKCEGGARVARRVRAMTDAGIAVMGHLGLTPQSQSQLGGYRVQGKTLAAVERVADDALVLRDAGVFSILLEAMPAEAAAYVRERVPDLLVYGIGAGPELDGQLVISHDLLGNFVGDIRPRFVRRYLELGSLIEGAFGEYAADVRAGRFPAPEHCYPIERVHEEEIRAARKTGRGVAGRPELQGSRLRGEGNGADTLLPPWGAPPEIQDRIEVADDRHRSPAANAIPSPVPSPSFRVQPTNHARRT